jgi:hypothetical protein
MDHTITQCHLDQLATAGREFACAPRVDLSAQSPSLFRFVRCEGDKLIPRGICNGFGKMSTAKHVPDVQILKDDNTEPIDQFSAHLMSEVATTVCNPLMSASHHLAAPGSLRCSLGRLTQFALGFSQCPFCLPEKSRILNLLSRRKGRELVQPAIHTHSLNRRLKGLGFHFHGKAGKPFSGRFSFNRQGFDPALNRSVQLDLDVSNLRQPQLAIGKSKARLRVGETVIARARAKARVARFLTRFDSAKERVKGFVQSPENVLQDLRVNRLHIWSYGLDPWQLGLLVLVVDGLPAKTIGVTPFLQRRIIEFAAYIQRLLKFPHLSFGWIYAVFERFSHWLNYRVKKSKRFGTLTMVYSNAGSGSGFLTTPSANA